MSRPVRREPGRCAIRVAEHLRALGLDVYAEQISIAEGYWRSSPHVDVYRWDAHCKAGTYGNMSRHMPISVVCWDRLTDCARYGIRVTQDGGPTTLEAHAQREDRTMTTLEAIHAAHGVADIQTITDEYFTIPLKDRLATLAKATEILSGFTDLGSIQIGAIDPGQGDSAVLIAYGLDDPQAAIDRLTSSGVRGAVCGPDGELILHF